MPTAIDEAALLGDLRTLVQSARQRIATAAYSTQTLLCWHKNLFAIGSPAALQVLTGQAPPHAPAQQGLGGIGRCRDPLAGRLDKDAEVAQQRGLVDGGRHLYRGPRHNRLGLRLGQPDLVPLDQLFHGWVASTNRPSSRPSASFSMARMSALISASVRKGCGL